MIFSELFDSEISHESSLFLEILIILSSLMTSRLSMLEEENLKSVLFLNFVLQSLRSEKKSSFRIKIVSEDCLFPRIVPSSLILK